MTTQQRPIVKDLLKCHELSYHFEHVIGVDDKKTPDQYTDEEIIAEALFVLERYDPSQGWTQGEEITSDDPQIRQNAITERNQIRSFLKKWAKTVKQGEAA